MHAGLLFISGCTAYDVVINPTFYNKIQNSELFKSFFLTIVFEGLESKYDLELERNWTVLKNKKCMGVLQPHFIRSKSKPVIMEMDDENTSTTKEGKTASLSFCCLHCGCYIPLLTFQPLLNDHPWGNGECRLKRLGHLIGEKAITDCLIGVAV